MPLTAMMHGVNMTALKTVLNWKNSMPLIPMLLNWMNITPLIPIQKWLNSTPTDTYTYLDE
jgi:hypothetical protein